MSYSFQIQRTTAEDFPAQLAESIDGITYATGQAEAAGARRAIISAATSLADYAHLGEFSVTVSGHEAGLENARKIQVTVMIGSITREVVPMPVAVTPLPEIANITVTGSATNTQSFTSPTTTTNTAVPLPKTSKPKTSKPKGEK